MPRPTAAGSSPLGGVARRAATTVLLAGLFVAGCSDGGGSPDAEGDTATTLAPGLEGPPADASETLIRLGDAGPGVIASLRAAGPTKVEWVDRERGVIVALDVTDPTLAPEVVAEVLVSTRGREWGLIDTVVLGDRRFATWTQPGAGDFDNGNLVVGELVDGVASRILFSAGRAGTARIAGQLEVLDDRLVLALGSEVGWADDNAVRGALVTLDPDGDQDQEPAIISTGYVDPRAILTVDAELWVWDRAQPPAAGQTTTDDVEHSGRADLTDRADLTARQDPFREPTAMVMLADGRFGVCGQLDGQLRAYEVTDGDTGPRTRLSGVDGPAVMSCASAATVLADGTIVTAAEVDGTQTLQVRRPASSSD